MIWIISQSMQNLLPFFFTLSPPGLAHRNFSLGARFWEMNNLTSTESFLEAFGRGKNHHFFLLQRWFCFFCFLFCVCVFFICFLGLRRGAVGVFFSPPPSFFLIDHHILEHLLCSYLYYTKSKEKKKHTQKTSKPVACSSRGQKYHDHIGPAHVAEMLKCRQAPTVIKIIQKSVSIKVFQNSHFPSFLS